MGRLRVILVVGFCLFALCLQAQKTKKVHGEYVYYAPENVTLEEAKRTALERAKIQALAGAFGTIVSQSNLTIIRNNNAESFSDFLLLGGSEVKGEWLETIGEPLYDISYTDGMLIVRVSITGQAREIVSAKIDVEVKVLRNGTEPKYESSEFRNGDDMYLYFKSPIDGYLIVYLLDEKTMQVYCLLPYRNLGVGAVKIIHDKPYVFFSAEKSEDPAEVDEYVMTCSSSLEYNVIYVIFSKNEITKALDSRSISSIPDELSFKNFQKWLSNLTKADNTASVIRKNIIIEK